MDTASDNLQAELQNSVQIDNIVPGKLVDSNFTENSIFSNSTEKNANCSQPIYGKDDDDFNEAVNSDTLRLQNEQETAEQNGNGFDNPEFQELHNNSAELEHLLEAEDTESGEKDTECDTNMINCVQEPSSNDDTTKTDCDKNSDVDEKEPAQNLDKLEKNGSCELKEENSTEVSNQENATNENLLEEKMECDNIPSDIHPETNCEIKEDYNSSGELKSENDPNTASLEVMEIQEVKTEEKLQKEESITNNEDTSSNEKHEDKVKEDIVEKPATLENEEKAISSEVQNEEVTPATEEKLSSNVEEPAKAELDDSQTDSAAKDEIDAEVKSEEQDLKEDAVNSDDLAEKCQDNNESNENESVPKVKKRMGRPPKKSKLNKGNDDPNKKKYYICTGKPRGRPRKQQKTEIDNSSIDIDNTTENSTIDLSEDLNEEASGSNLSGRSLRERKPRIQPVIENKPRREVKARFEEESENLMLEPEFDNFNVSKSSSFDDPDDLLVEMEVVPTPVPTSTGRRGRPRKRSFQRTLVNPRPVKTPKMSIMAPLYQDNEVVEIPDSDDEIESNHYPSSNEIERRQLSGLASQPTLTLPKRGRPSKTATITEPRPSFGHSIFDPQPDYDPQPGYDNDLPGPSFELDDDSYSTLR